MSSRRARPVPRQTGSNDLSPEAAVRLYLEYLANPGSFDNSVQTEALSRKAEATKDVLVKLAIVRDARRARADVGTEFRDNFVRLARRYADEQELVAEDFRALGVPSRVLSKAGFVVRGRGTRRSRSERSTLKPVGDRTGKEELAAMRKWATANGYSVSARGRIPAQIIGAYRAAH